MQFFVPSLVVVKHCTGALVMAEQHRKIRAFLSYSSAITLTFTTICITQCKVLDPVSYLSAVVKLEILKRGDPAKTKTKRAVDSLVNNRFCVYFPFHIWYAKVSTIASGYRSSLDNYTNCVMCNTSSTTI